MTFFKASFVVLVPKVLIVGNEKGKILTLLLIQFLFKKLIYNSQK